MSRPLLGALSLACVLLLSGCSSLEGSGDQGYVSGDGAVHDPRRRPTATSRSSSPARTSTATPLDLADFRGKPTVVNVWGSWCAECVAEAPDLVDAAERARRLGQLRRHQHPRPVHRPGAGARPQVRRRVPVVLRAGRPRAARVQRRPDAARRSRPPSSSTPRAGSPPASSARSRRPRRSSTSSRTSPPSRPPMGDWFHDTAAVRVDAARRPGGADRRTGLVLLAVRAAAAARLPLLRHRPVRRRPRQRDGRHPARPAVPRLAAVRARLRGGVRRSSAARSVRSATGWSSYDRELGVVLGVDHDRARPGLRGLAAVPPAGLADPHGARRRAGGGAAARLPVRRRLDAVPRPDPGRDHRALDQRGHRRARRAARRRSTPSGSACRSSWPGSPTRSRSRRSRSSAATRSG